MTARAMSSATISFGLVSIPIKLYAATESSRKVSFNLIHKDCGSRLKQQYICKKEDVVVPREEMVKGYEFAKGQYVLFDDEELKALEEEATQRLDITEFVPLDQVDRIFIDRFYYLGPDKGGDRAYRLLHEAMGKTGLAALAKYAARGKQYLVLVRPMNGRLVMEQLHYDEEIRAIEEVPVEDVEVKGSELQLAVQLIEQSASEAFDPGRYEDEVGERMLAAIQEKVEGREISVAPAAAPETQVIDLMEALKKSIVGEDGEKKPAKRAKRKSSSSEKKAASGK